MALLQLLPLVCRGWRAGAARRLLLTYPTLRRYECNATHPLDGTIPFPMASNTYLSPNADYRMHCRDTTWTLAQAQALGVDVGSTVGALPTVDALVAMAHDRLQF